MLYKTLSFLVFLIFTTSICFAQNEYISGGLNIGYGYSNGNVIKIGYADKSIGTKLPFKSRERQQVVIKNCTSSTSFNTSYNFDKNTLGIHLNSAFGKTILLGYGLNSSWSFKHTDLNTMLALSLKAGLNYHRLFLYYSNFVYTNDKWNNSLSKHDISIYYLL